MTGSHNYWLVLLSVVVAITASYVALDLTSRVAASHGRRAARRYWLGGGAISMGSGIWSMHFIGVLGFRLPTAVSYDIPITLLSLLIAVTASGFALVIASSASLGVRWLLGGGVLMGIAIAAMHYTGMAAMRMDPPIRYQSSLLSLSILIAVAASVVALSSAYKFRMDSILSAFWKKAGSALVMGSAIYGMHYTGMAAAQFAPHSVSKVSPAQDIDPVWFAAVLGALTLLFLVGTMLVSAYDAYESTGQLGHLSRRLVEIQDEERRALAAELHDIVGQTLSALGAELALIRSRLPPSAAEASGKLMDASRLVMQSVEAIRSVMARLRPPGLDELGLPAALRWHAAEFESRTGIAVTVVADETLPKPSAAVEDALLRVCLEALTNVSKHSGARKVEARLEPRDGHIAMTIADNGCGFDIAATPRRDDKSGWGLLIMRERAAAVGAELRIESAPGAGTRVEFEISKDKW